MDNELSILDLVEKVKQLKREGDYLTASKILFYCTDWIDCHAFPDNQKPPWYFEQLGIVLKKLGNIELAEYYTNRYDEIVIYNHIIQARNIDPVSSDVDKTYYPKGLPISKTVVISAKRLKLRYDTEGKSSINPEILRSIIDNFDSDYKWANGYQNLDFGIGL